MSKPVYLDYAASTPTDLSVVDAMRPWTEEKIGNPHSEHLQGWTANEAIECAREQIATLLGANPNEIIFTSGATEANNLALKGVMCSQAKLGNHLIVSGFEHKCILEAAKYLERIGCRLTMVNPDSDGVVQVNKIRDAIESDTALVSVMSVNNELGTIQPILEIAEICNEQNVIFHTDNAQGAGKLSSIWNKGQIHLMSISSHKMYGPKGIGALVVSNNLKFKLEPLMHGGGQEFGIRSGTLSPALCVGFGKAAEICSIEMVEERLHTRNLARRLISGLHKGVPGLKLNSEAARLPHICNFQFPGVDGSEILLLAQKALSASTGSACNSGNIEPSYALVSIGLNLEKARSSIRLSIGRQTTQSEIDEAITALTSAFKTASALVTA
jgi:cysteine desulfurase